MSSFKVLWCTIKGVAQKRRLSLSLLVFLGQSLFPAVFVEVQQYVLLGIKDHQVSLIPMEHDIVLSLTSS